MAVYDENQQHYTGRAMIALSAGHMELIEAVKALLEVDPDAASVIAMSAAKNLEKAANFIRLAINPAVAAQAVAVTAGH